MLITDIVAQLNVSPAVTSLVNNRIGPVPAPEDLSQYPCITYQSPSYVPEYANEGSIGVTVVRVIFNCLSAQYLQARTLAEAVGSAFSGFSGVLPNGTRVFMAEVVNIVDGYNDGSRISRCSTHVLFQFSD